MVLQWFGRSQSASIPSLIARKSYPRAIEAIKAELQKRRHDRSLRLKLADVLVLAGRPKEAVEVLGSLADDLALKGQAAQAIAALKKIQALAPGREDVEEKLAYLIKQESAPAPDPWAARARPAPVEDEPAEIGLEMEAVAAPDRAVPPAPEAFPTDEEVRDELVALIESALTPSAEAEAAPTPGLVVATPLFRDFSPEELVAVIRGLRLVSFQAGEIVCTEGEAGGSLFVLTSGRVRAYVRDAAGRNAQMRELAEGDFFGEASILSGKPRSATITAAEPTELLELDRPTLEGIAATHPRVWDVLREFHDQRAGSTVEAAVRLRARS